MRVKISKQPPPAPTASAVGPCPTIIQIVGPKEIALFMRMCSNLKVPWCITKCIPAIFCSNSFSHCRVDQKKTVTISQMLNHVQLYAHWMHLLNTRMYRYTYVTPTVIYCDRYVIMLFNLEMDSTAELLLGIFKKEPTPPLCSENGATVFCHRAIQWFNRNRSLFLKWKINQTKI